MNKEFVMRGQTASGSTEVLQFSGFKPGMAYRLTEFQLYHSTNIGTSSYEMCGSITAGKTAIAPTDVNFNDQALIACGLIRANSAEAYPHTSEYVINDTFLITQNLILMVQDTAGSNYPINWQCRFESVKMSGPQEAVNNYKQYLISDD
jgi:hypothetical protein